MALSNIACRRLLNSALSGVHHPILKRGPASVSKKFFLHKYIISLICHICGIFGYIFLHLNDSDTDVLDYT